jgi:hypothetical protein
MSHSSIRRDLGQYSFEYALPILVQPRDIRTSMALLAALPRRPKWAPGRTVTVSPMVVSTK